MNIFRNLHEVRQLTQPWVYDYNKERPHESLAGLSPVLFAKMREEKLKPSGLGDSTFN